MKQYMDLIKTILDQGHDKEDRTGTGTRSIFGYQMRFDLKKEFPILKEKFTSFRLIKQELIWFLSGCTNIKYLTDNNNHIWDEWADKDGNLGPVYGKQWRSWNKYTVKSSEEQTIHDDGAITHFNAKVTVTPHDQIQEVIDTLKTAPDSRRIIVSAWNVGELDRMALPPCHSFFQFYTRVLNHDERTREFLTYRSSVSDEEQQKLRKQFRALETIEEERKFFDVLEIPTRALSCQLYQRSADVALGIPFNISSYALLTHMIAQVVNMVPDEFIHTLGDAHLYKNHFDGVKTLLSRDPINQISKLILNPNIKNIDDFKQDDINLDNYLYHPKIDFEIAV